MNPTFGDKLARLLRSRRFWLAVLSVVATAVAPALGWSAFVVDAVQKFALVLILAFTIDDTAAAVGRAAR